MIVGSAFAYTLVTSTEERERVVQSFESLGLPKTLLSLTAENVLADSEGRVSRWKADDGNFLIVQTNKAFQPHLDTTYGDFPVLRFDGKAQHFIADDLAPTLAELESLTVVIIGDVDSSPHKEKQAFFSANRHKSGTPTVFVGIDPAGHFTLKTERKSYSTASTPFRSKHPLSLLVAQHWQTGGRLFVNGELLIDFAELGDIQFDKIRFVSIGQEWSIRGTSDLLEGIIAEIHLFDHALSDQHLKALERYATGKYPSLHLTAQ
jgi:hypothetical protein